jgi:acyl-CoA thioester hydrolase
MTAKPKTARSVETIVKAQFYDLDPMDIVWHGNYARFLEQARCDLLDRLDYNYAQMKASGFAFPVVHLQVKYVKPIRMAQQMVITTTLTEHENRLRLDYVIRDRATREVLTRAYTIQVAVAVATGELCLESPPVLIERVNAWT